MYTICLSHPTKIIKKYSVDRHIKKKEVKQGVGAATLERQEENRQGAFDRRQFTSAVVSSAEPDTSTLHSPA